MSTALVARDAKGRWQPGSGSPNPHGMPVQTTGKLWRNLLRESVGTQHDGSPYTRAAELFDVAYRRAMDEDRKDAVLWAKLILERAEGPARTDSDDSLGLPAILRDAHERWLVKQAKADSAQGESEAKGIAQSEEP